MSFRFWKRIRVAPGVSLNLSRSGGSLSFGPRGAKLTVGPRGRRATVGIPGTGLWYTARARPGEGARGGRGTSRPAADTLSVPEADRLTLGFFRRLVTPDDEKALVEGCRELALGDEDTALEHLRMATHLADGAYLAGFQALKKNRLEEAAEYLTAAAANHDRLGRYLSRYGISATLVLPITDEVTAQVGPDLRGALLGLVEVYQRLERRGEAVECLERLRRLEPDDAVVKLSLAELLIENGSDDKDACRKVVRLAEGIENESPVHAALLLYKARALRGLGLPDAARETLTAALRRRKDRSRELLRAIRYERARVYEDLGRKRQARADLERLYAGDPDYEDVAARLGFGKTSPDENGSSCNAGRQERRPALTRAPGRNTARFRTYSNPEVRR